MNQNLKHIQLTTNATKRCFAVVQSICPSMHRMWAVAGYPVVGGGAV